MKCPCCESETIILRQFPEPHLFCVTCGHHRKSFRPPKDYYGKLSGRSKMLEKDLKNKIAERVKYLRPYLNNGVRILEIGCAEGALGKKIKDNFKVFYCGIEPSHDAEIAATKLDRVWKSVEKVPSKTRFDFIFLFHTLEHVDNIGRLVSTLYSLLSSQGSIVVEVPYCFGNKFLPWDHNKEHTHLFSPASISCLLEKHGFNVREISANHFESAVYNDSMRIIATKRKTFGELKNVMVNRFKQSLGDRYVIYGTGGDFKSLALPYIKAAAVAAILDSSKDKIGKRMLGKIIQGPEALVDHPNEKILIATYRYQKEIIKLLEKRGVKKTRIITLEDVLFYDEQ